MLRRASLPGSEAAPKLFESEQTDTPFVLHRLPYFRRVIASGRQKQADVVQVGRGGDVLQGFELVLDKPEDRAPPVCRRVLGDKRTQIVIFKGTRLLALNVGQVHPPMIQDLTGEFPFFGGDEHRTLELRQQTTDVVEWAVRGMAGLVANLTQEVMKGQLPWSNENWRQSR